jgi:Ca2+-binding EF-hand superfamily protein
VYKDPLSKLFDDFDADSDGSLTAGEITNALRSRGVQITAADVKDFISLVDRNENEKVEKEEFGNLVFALASAEMLVRS